jgi:pimeloyl-ACP methyl ester carboxylesterase
VRYARACLDELPLQQWAASWRVLAGFAAPTRDELPDVPAILIAAEADSSTPPSLMEQIRARTPGDPEMVVLPGAPHLAVLTHHVAVAEALQDLLEAVER